MIGCECPHYDCDQALQVQGARYWCSACARKYADIALQDTGQPDRLLPCVGEFFACPGCTHPMLLQLDTVDRLYYWHCDTCETSWSLAMQETADRTATVVGRLKQ